MATTRYYAFWDYDLFPYLLGAAVTKFRGRDGKTPKAYAPAYGGWVRYKFLLPPKRGAELVSALNELRQAKRQVQKDMDAEFKLKRNAIIERFDRTG